jgi:hypothetical protein
MLKNTDFCPFCTTGVEPIILKVYVDGSGPNLSHRTTSWIIYRCPRNACRNIYIGVYRYYQSNFNSHFQGPITVYPVFPKKKSFNETILEISPSFEKIYNQAYFAEQNNLDLIAGPGYRKALEFLIKDYAKKISDKDDGEKIENIFLGNVIENYIDDERIKDVAKRAAWLGNDETHYLRRWDGEDLESLKLLIKLTTRWIESVELTRQFKEDMPE